MTTKDELLATAHDLIRRYSETRDAALTDDQHRAEAWLVSYAALRAFVCPSVVFHGPGHQSKTRCEIRTPHPIDGEHWASDPMCPGFEWTGPKDYC
jgi:hypothetical protein